MIAALENTTAINEPELSTQEMRVEIKSRRLAKNPYETMMQCHQTSKDVQYLFGRAVFLGIESRIRRTQPR